MMEAARTSETLVSFYQTTWCYNPEDSNLRFNCLLQFFQIIYFIRVSNMHFKSV
jgi:hypothetical protein